MVANSDPDPHADRPAADLEPMNDLLAAWAARSAATSAALIDRLETMGYEVRGKSEDEIAEVLHRPPARKPTAARRDGCG